MQLLHVIIDALGLLEHVGALAHIHALLPADSE